MRKITKKYNFSKTPAYSAEFFLTPDILGRRRCINYMAKKDGLALIAAVTIIAMGIVVYLFIKGRQSDDISDDLLNGNNGSSAITTNNISPDNPASPMAEKKSGALPIDRALERVTKKPFGIFITPKDSPVQPERFSGYHTGTDFETFPDEQNSDVPVYAITNGKILIKKSASGYGGVLVESGKINGEAVTIIYGHLNLASINKKTGDALSAGERIGILGQGFSRETDGERKHLHLGIHKGSSVNILGYVAKKSDLEGWIDYS
jgi:hypothetical protein